MDIITQLAIKQYIHSQLAGVFRGKTRTDGNSIGPFFLSDTLEYVDGVLENRDFSKVDPRERGLLALHAGKVDPEILYLKGDITKVPSGGAVTTLDEIRFMMYVQYLAFKYHYLCGNKTTNPFQDMSSQLKGMEKIRYMFVQYLTKTQCNTFERNALAFGILLEKRKLGLPCLFDHNEYNLGMYSPGDFTHLDLSFLEIIRLAAVEDHGNFKGLNLSHSNLDGSTFSGMRLLGANLTGASMRGADFTEAEQFRDAVYDKTTNVEGMFSRDQQLPYAKGCKRLGEELVCSIPTLIAYRKKMFPDEFGVFIPADSIPTLNDIMSKSGKVILNLSQKTMLKEFFVEPFIRTLLEDKALNLAQIRFLIYFAQHYAVIEKEVETYRNVYQRVLGDLSEHSKNAFLSLKSLYDGRIDFTRIGSEKPSSLELDVTINMLILDLIHQFEEHKYDSQTQQARIWIDELVFIFGSFTKDGKPETFLNVGLYLEVIAEAFSSLVAPQTSKDEFNLDGLNLSDFNLGDLLFPDVGNLAHLHISKALKANLTNCIFMGVNANMHCNFNQSKLSGVKFAGKIKAKQSRFNDCLCDNVDVTGLGASKGSVGFYGSCVEGMYFFVDEYTKKSGKEAVAEYLAEDCFDSKTKFKGISGFASLEYFQAFAEKTTPPTTEVAQTSTDDLEQGDDIGEFKDAIVEEKWKQYRKNHPGSDDLKLSFFASTRQQVERDLSRQEIIKQGVTLQVRESLGGIFH